MAWYQGLMLLATVSTAFGLNCYHCDSSQSSLCNYGIASWFYKSADCNVDKNPLTNLWPKECVKFTAINKDGERYVARGCMPQTGGACKVVATTLNFFTDVDGVQDIQCYTCETDNCNSAVRFAGFSLLTVVLAIVSFVF